MPTLAPIDYLVVGHYTRDLTPAGDEPGGTVTYSAATAAALGCRTGVVTSAAADVPFASFLPGVAVVNVTAPESTTFANHYSPAGRQQHIYAQALPLKAAQVPAAWRRTPIVHLGPVANELDPDLARAFPASLLGLTPQGWFRRWDARGRVRAEAWEAAGDVLPRAAGVVLSPEDLPRPALAAELARLSRLLVVTEEARGCTVFFDGERRRFPAPAVTVANPTGAGDVFAAAFFLRLQQTRGNPWEAAAFANLIAAHSLAADSLADKMAAIRETAALARA
ncbi:MAG: PfkB family carbohydrate kinase [Candidatus Promineifilaceae bacterium]